jgi:hypothetical protein
MQRREAKIGLRDRKCHRRPKEQNDTGENPHRNGMFYVGREIFGLGGLDGGRDRARTSRSTTVAGNGIFGGRDEAPEIVVQPLERLQRPKSRK